MAETEKKTRRERGLNIRVVQEQKEKKSDNVRVNTRSKKTPAKKKTAKKTTAKATKTKETKEVKKTKKAIEVKEVKEVKKVKEAKEIKEPKKNETAEETPKEVAKEALKEVAKDSAKEDTEYKDLEWRKEEPEKEEKQEEDRFKSELTDYFETLTIPATPKKAEPKIIVRDVAKEKPITFTRSTDKSIKAQPKMPAKKLPERTAIARPTVAPARPAEKLSAREIKEREIKKAVNMATKLPETSKKQNRRSRLSGNFNIARAVLAIACLSTAVFAIVYFVNLNSSDISLKVAAMQSGIEAVYPSYTPRGYTLADVTSASGKITMKFKSSENGGCYTITEEQTDWNSAGALGNFIKPTFGDEYAVIEEQGLTIYMGDRWAAWVNGGMLYKLTVDSGSLTKKQIKTIAVSL